MTDRYVDVPDETLLRWLHEVRERRVRHKACVRNVLARIEAGGANVFFLPWRLMCAMEASRCSRIRARRLAEEWARRKRWRVGAWRITDPGPNHIRLEHVARPELTLSVSRYGSGATLCRRLSGTLGEQLAWFAVAVGPDEEMAREAVRSANIAVAHLRDRA